MKFASWNENRNAIPSQDEGLWGFLMKIILFFEQVVIMCQKHVSLKRNSRQFLTDSIMMQFFLVNLTRSIMLQSSTYYETPHVYNRIPLPPLSKSSPNGIFNVNSPGNEERYQLSQRLYYAPNTHAGVNALMDALKNLYPDVEIEGVSDSDGITSMYEKNLFDTWASLDFQLNSDQVSSGLLITSQTQPSNVAYTISTNPTIWGNLPVYNYTSPIYNEEVGPADLFWSSGYLTLQNFVDEYLVQQYNGAEDFSVRKFILVVLHSFSPAVFIPICILLDRNVCSTLSFLTSV